MLDKLKFFIEGAKKTGNYVSVRYNSEVIKLFTNKTQ